MNFADIIVPGRDKNHVFYNYIFQLFITKLIILGFCIIHC